MTNAPGDAMYPNKHAEARCQNRDKCTGPGCRIETGKTERKRNTKPGN